MQMPEPPTPPLLSPQDNLPPASSPSIRSNRRWRSGQWKAFSAAMAMITALAVVWALLSSFTVRQREADLEAAMTELNDLREQLRDIEPYRIGDRTVEDMLEEILSLPDPESL